MAYMYDKIALSFADFHDHKERLRPDKAAWWLSILTRGKVESRTLLHSTKYQILHHLSFKSLLTRDEVSNIIFYSLMFPFDSTNFKH